MFCLLWRFVRLLFLFDSCVFVLCMFVVVMFCCLLVVVFFLVGVLGGFVYVCVLFVID